MLCYVVLTWRLFHWMVQKEVLSSYDVDAKTVGIAAGNVAVSDR